MGNNDRLVNATEAITEALREQYKRNFSSIGDALVEAEKRGHPVARKRRDDLKLVRETRNSIQHSTRRGEAAVVASDWMVELTEELSKAFLKPTPVSSLMLTDFYRCDRDEKLHVVLAEMVRNDFSQAPVFESDKFVALLTTNAIARWVSANVEDSGELYMEASAVGEVLGSLEEHESPAIVKHTAPVSDVVEILTDPDFQSGCVLVTDTGNTSGRMMGMVTKFDLPQLYEAL